MRALENKIITTNLSDVIARIQNKIIVSTNGCFDILHYGHISYLYKARSLGDVLICCLNSDTSVKRLKGEGRPVFSENIRAKQLAALECVDYVVIFEEHTPEKILSLIKPNIHVKGGDYDVNTLPEKAIVEGNGGKIVIIPLVQGFSTTGLIEKILRSTTESKKSS